MRVLITGASGFVGRALTGALAERGGEAVDTLLQLHIIILLPSPTI